MAKAMTLRLAEDQAAALEMIARADETTTSEAVRSAIDEAIERKRNDPEFQARLRAIVEQDRAVLERLAH